jgi:hypothetical protein
MQLFGSAAWWMPDWLGKRLPRIAVEPGTPEPLPEAD